MIISYSTLVEQTRQNIKEIDIQQLAEIPAGQRCLIDVREPAEFAGCHIADAVCMPRGVIEAQICNHPSVAGQPDAMEKLAAQDIYLICRSGARSAFAAESLAKMGFENVYSVAGGMLAWEQAGLAVE